MAENTTPDDGSCEVAVRLDDDETWRTLQHAEVDAEESRLWFQDSGFIEDGEVTPR